ncbi:UNVERIFIED_CONTAM: hypothetical protein FKN15_043431 [Acipenser sinensis]
MNYEGTMTKVQLAILKPSVIPTICLGVEAVDEFHTVEIEGMNYEGTMTKVQLAILKPSVIPTISLGGFEITPPVTFRLKSGSGPVFISGQHFISAKEEEEGYEEENNTFPVKRLSNSTSSSLLAPKKLKFDNEDDDDEEEEDDDEDDNDDDDDDDKKEDSPPKTPQKNETPGKKETEPKSASKHNSTPGKTGTQAAKPQPENETPGKKETEPKSVSKHNSTPGKTGTQAAKPQPETPHQEKENSGAIASLSVNEVKDKLKTMVSEGRALPKTQKKFVNYAKFTYKIVDQKDYKHNKALQGVCIFQIFEYTDFLGVRGTRLRLVPHNAPRHPYIQRPRQHDVSANQGFHERPSQKPQMLGTSLIFSRGAAFRVITLICVFSVTGFSTPGMVEASPPVGDPFLSSVAGPFAPEMMAASPSVGDHLFYPVSVAGSSTLGMCGIVALSQ